MAALLNLHHCERVLLLLERLGVLCISYPGDRLFSPTTSMTRYKLKYGYTTHTNFNKHVTVCKLAGYASLHVTRAGSL